MRRLLILLSLLIVATCGWSQSAEERAQTAFQQLDAQRYPLAISTYEQLLNEGYSSSELHYNLGLAYYRTEKLGPAILQMEKAKKLAPYDKEIRKNLDLLRNEQEDGLLPIPTFFLYDWWHRVAARLQPDTWGVLAIFFTFIGAAILMNWLWFRNGAGTPTWYPTKRAAQLPFYGAMLILLAILFIFFANSRTKALARTDQAVILFKKAEVRIAPGTDTEIDFEVHEGLRVRLLDNFEGWRKIELVDGRTGWVQDAEVGVI